MEDYYSIKEFAEKVNKTPQSLYKRLKKKDNELKAFYKVKGKKKYIHKDALKLYSQPVDKPVEKEVEQPVEQPVENTNQISITTIEQQAKTIDDLIKQLQIAQENLGREQALHADTKKELKSCRDELKLLQSSNKSKPVDKPVDKPATSNNKPKKKNRFLSWLRGNNEEN